MAAEPSIVIEIDLDNYVARLSNREFPNQRVTLDRQTIQDIKAVIYRAGTDGVPDLDAYGIEITRRELLRRYYNNEFS